MLKVLGRATSSNVQKVVWALDEMDVEYERSDIGGSFGGNREADYLRLNPNGLIPTLIDGDAVVWESNTILRYLANRFGWSALYPGASHALARSEVECWMDWQQTSLNPGIGPLFVSIIRTPPSQRDAALIEQHRERTLQALRVLDAALARRFADGPFVCGEAFTLADIALGPQVHRWFELPIERDELPALARWHEKLRHRPAFARHVMIGLS